MTLWHVYIEDHQTWLAVEDDSNAGPGPVNVWHKGFLKRVTYRHRTENCSPACGFRNGGWA